MNASSAKVTIDNADVAEKEGSFTNDAGEKVAYATRKQTARLEIGGFAYPYEIRLEKDQKRYEAGVYELDLAAMIEVNKKSLNLAKYPVLRTVAGK